MTTEQRIQALATIVSGLLASGHYTWISRSKISQYSKYLMGDADSILKDIESKVEDSEPWTAVEGQRQ